MKKSIILGVLILSVAVPALTLAAQSNLSTQASISGNTASVTVQSDTSIPNSLVDFELYDSTGNKVTQSYATVDIPNGTISCSLSMAAPAGTYTLRVGIFNNNWTTLYNWNNAAATATGPFTGTNLVTCNGASVPTTYISSAAVQGSTAGSSGTFTTTVQASQAVAHALIDTEVYDAANNKISQWYETDALQAGVPLSVMHTSTLPSVGTYFVKVGVFSPDWSTVYSWNNAAGTFTTVATTSSSGSSNPPAPTAPAANVGVINPVTQTVQPGASVDFSGHNFGHEETVLIARNGAAVTSAHADGGGNFSTGSIGMPNTNGTYAFTFTGQTSGTVGTSTIQIGPVTQPQQTGTLNINLASTPVPQSITPGGAQLFANILLDATASAENIKVTSLPLSFTGTVGDISGCQLVYATTPLNTGARIVSTLSASGANTFSFDNVLTIPKGTVVTLSLVCNVSSAAAFGNTYRFGINSAYTYVTTGSVSGATITPAVTTNAGPVMTVSASSLEGSTDVSAPPYSLVAGGTTGVPVNALMFHATNEPIALQKVGLKLTSGSAQDLSEVNLYAGTNLYTTSGAAIPANSLIGTATFLGNSTMATSTFNMQVVVPANTNATVVLRADIADIGTNQPGTEGDLVAVDYLNAQGVGINSGVTINSAQSGVGVAGIRIVNTIPTVFAGPGPFTLTGGSNQVLEKFNISASSFGSVGLSKLNFALATTSLAVTNLQLHAYTDSGYSQPANVYGSPSGQFGSTIATASNNALTFQQTSNPFELGAGSTIYFALTGNTTPVADATTWSVTSTLLGDSMFDGMKQASVVLGNFIWSPNATSTAPFNQNDWTDGIGVSGLPTTGLSQTRTN